MISLSFFLEICLNIGNSIARLHSCVIHGDLTSSNIIITNSKLNDDVIIQFIDFGLSYCETLAEDMAVDLYVLERSLQVAHSNNCLVCFFFTIKNFDYSKISTISII